MAVGVGGFVVWGVGWAAYAGVREPGAACAFGGVVLLGELLRVPPGTDREGAPLATAGGLGYALLGPTAAGVAQAVAVVAVATGAAGLMARAAGPRAGHGRHGRHARKAGPPRVEAAARRVLLVAFAAVCCQPLGGGDVLTGTAGAPRAAFLVAVLGATALWDAVLAAAVGAAVGAAGGGRPFAPGLRDGVRGLAGIGSAVCAGGVVMALAVRSAGLWAVPLVALPLLLTQASLRGHAAVRATYRQTVGALARATEVAGYTPPGHARRVSELAVAVGRELGLPARQLTLLEYAALMHDIGQLSLVDPVPGGATEPLDGERRQTIAALGGEVVRRTGAPSEVALIVERQAHPFREQPLAGRIVRAVNAYEDLTAEAAAPAGRLAAVERLRLATGYEYDPRVVEALTRVLARQSTRTWLDAGGEGKEVG
ncbi:metal-dependent phosphohydrolase [Streptomyces sp. PLK6-54]|uniref:Metal-dependent phosphohydrolase n=1 Tax=Actinacidiphila acidipaludis TaxID=2873382 RepID=A0ABS7QEX2_9ACTN|nr:metal-dependent phosphohydrolase [Streptomyces acidipaludis]